MYRQTNVYIVAESKPAGSFVMCVLFFTGVGSSHQMHRSTLRSPQTASTNAQSYNFISVIPQIAVSFVVWHTLELRGKDSPTGVVFLLQGPSAYEDARWLSSWPLTCV